MFLISSYLFVPILEMLKCISTCYIHYSAVKIAEKKSIKITFKCNQLILGKVACLLCTPNTRPRPYKYDVFLWILVIQLNTLIAITPRLLLFLLRTSYYCEALSFDGGS